MVSVVGRHFSRQQRQPFPQALRFQHLHSQTEGEQIAIEPRILRKAHRHHKAAVRPAGDAALVEFVVDPVGKGGGEAQADGNAEALRRLSGLDGRGREGALKGSARLRLQHPGELEGAVGRPLQAEPLEVPVPALEDQPRGEDAAAGGLAGGAHIGEGQDAAGQNGLLELDEFGVVGPGAPPSGQLHLKPVRFLAPEQGGQLGQGPRRPLTGVPGQAPQSGEQQLLFFLGESGPVEGIALQQGHPAALARRAVHRYPGRRQRVDVPVDGAHRYLEVLRQLRRGHAAPLQQETEQLKQSALGHQRFLSRAITSVST